MRKDIDTIKITIEELKKILQWRDANQDIVRKYKNVFNEAIISSKEGRQILHFKVLDEEHTEYRYFYDDILIVKAICSRTREGMFCIDRVGNMEDYSINQRKYAFHREYFDKHFPGAVNTLEDFIAENTTIHCSLMAYITYRASEVEIIEEDFMKPERLKKALKHNKYNPTNQIKIKKKVIRLKNPTFKNITKKEIVRVAESWGVRGHPRMRNGKQEWVRPYVKGKGARKVKEYKVE